MISEQEFRQIFGRKILEKLNEPPKFKFEDLIILFNTYNQWTFENKSEDMFSAFNTQKQKRNFCTDTPLYELCSNLIGVINLLSIFIRDEIVEN